MSEHVAAGATPDRGPIGAAHAIHLVLQKQNMGTELSVQGLQHRTKTTALLRPSVNCSKRYGWGMLTQNLALRILKQHAWLGGKAKLLCGEQ